MVLYLLKAINTAKKYEIFSFRIPFLNVSEFTFCYKSVLFIIEIMRIVYHLDRWHVNLIKSLSSVH